MLRKILPISAAIFGLASLPGQTHSATATATASATVLTPIAISTTNNMSFGDLYADNATAGTLVLATTGARSVTGGVTTGATAGAAAAFAVVGNASANFAVTLPDDVTVVLTGPGTDMAVTTFNSDAGTALDATGNASFNVGATLNVAASQTPGAYTGSFDVIVNYN